MDLDTFLLTSILGALLIGLWLGLRLFFLLRAEHRHQRESLHYGRPYDRPAPWEHDEKPRPNIRRA